MKKIVLASLLALFLAFPIIAQDEVETVTLPDAVMEQLVRRIVTWYFKPRSRPTEIHISAQNIKKEWLPSIKNIEFVIVPEDPNDVASDMYFFRSLDKEPKGFSIGFGRGNPGCHSYGDIWEFRVVNDRVRLSTNTGQFGSHCSQNTSGAAPKQ